MQNTPKFKVVEIFESIEGEGKRAGNLATFIRLAGCNLRCDYCDTTYAFCEDGTGYTEMTIDEILGKINRDIYNITLTGGEPLLAPNVHDLIYALQKKNLVNIETNGSVDISPFKNSSLEFVFFTIDYKLPSSGETSKMLMSNYTNEDVLKRYDVLKFVVGDENDIDHMVDFLSPYSERMEYGMFPQIYIGAVYNKYPNKKIVEAMLKNKILSDATLQLQLHKIVWDPNERGV